jgi:hypothetical protein
MKRFLLAFMLAVAGLALLASPALASAKTFYVPAPSSGGNDTATIQAAFNAAVKAGPGSTVQLSAGYFYTNTILVKNFHGHFKGAGEGKTTIDCLRGLDASLPGMTVLPGYFYTFLFGFDGGNVSVSDLSVDVTAAAPGDWSNNGTPADYLMQDVFVTGNASSHFDHVAFRAGSGSDTGSNTDGGIVVMGNLPPSVLTSGTDSICDCAFSGMPDGIQTVGLTDGRATITGNVFNVSNFSVMADDTSASQVTISHNQMTAASFDDIVLWQGYQATNLGAPLPSLPAPQFVITDNSMLGTDYAGGVDVTDDSPLYDAPYRLHAVIADNDIRLDNGGYDGGIDGIYAQGIQVLNNHIWGTGLAGIDVGALASLVGIPSAPDSGWRIIGNDVSGLTAVADQYGVSTAQILLGPDASHCLVVGGCRPTTVLDQGTDDTLINVTQLPLPAAASAPAAVPTHSLRQMKQLKGMMRP